MKLTRNARRAWRWFSVQAMTAVASLQLVWMGMPAELRDSVPDHWLPWVTVAVAVGGVVGRLIDQGGQE